MYKKQILVECLLFHWRAELAIELESTYQYPKGTKPLESFLVSNIKYTMSLCKL